MLPFAAVVPPNAPGMVQFKDGDKKIDGLQPVLGGGFAIGRLTHLGVGRHTITAVFIPDNPLAFKSSTSNPVTVEFR